MISIKSPREIELMRVAGHIVALTLEAVEPHIRPGVSTLHLDKICEDFILSQDAKPNFKGYQGFPGTACISVNEELVHGIPHKDRLLKEGDIVTIDVGCLYKGYHGDGAKTFGVGEVSKEARQLMEVTEASLYAGLKVIKPGIQTGDISHAIGAYIKPYGYGIPMDFTGHGIGRQLHEDPAIFNDGKTHRGPILKEGMVICVEPMVQLGTDKTVILSDGWTVVSKDKKITAHYEHMVAVTHDGYDILTK